MTRLAFFSVIFALACGNPRRAEDPLTPREQVAPLPPETTPSGDAGSVTTPPPPDPEGKPDVPHGMTTQPREPRVAQATPDAGVRVDAAVDAQTPGVRIDAGIDAGNAGLRPDAGPR